MPAPELFRIALEEHGIKLSPEPVDIEILQTIFFFFHKYGFEVTEACFHGGGKTHIPYGCSVHFNGVVKKFPAVINPGYPVPSEHDAVFLFRIRSAFL